jgi:Cu(I)/Ag(I) efflux system membrane fusion protein
VTDNTGHFKSVAVVLGGRDERYFEVTDGLLPDDIVVVSAQFLIDSESSKDSDLMRMSEPDNQATTTGKIVALPERFQASSEEDQQSKITIARGPIEKWGRGPATMEFVLSPHIDLSSFSVGDDIVFTFVTGDDFTVVQLKPGNAVGASSLSHDSHSHNSDTQTGNMQSHEHHQEADEDKSMEHMNHD